MKSFKQSLLEATLTQSEALEILGISSFADKSELKKAFKRASIKNHPDKGGTAEAMQKVNAAYTVLSKGGSSKSGTPYRGEPSKQSHEQWKKDIAKQAAEFSALVEEQMEEHFDFPKYMSYLTEACGKPLTFSSTIKKSVQPHITQKWETDDKKIVFVLDLYFYQESSKGLADPNSKMSIAQISYSTEVLINRKKVKMKQSEYKYGAKAQNIFKDPKASFAAAKIKKALNDVNKPLKKADYMLTFKNELGGKVLGNDIRIPMNAKDDRDHECYIWIERYTWMRKGMYRVIAVYNGNGTVASKGVRFKDFAESPNRDLIDLVATKIKKLKKEKSIEKLIKQLEKDCEEIHEFAMDDWKKMHESEEPQTFKSLLL